MTQIISNKNRIVTVIGGSGFIGSHVTDQLIDEGYQNGRKSNEYPLENLPALRTEK